MSAGAVFKLIANDGRADRMIMATELVNQRIKDIMCMRAKQGFQDPTPTLVDIERTHILYVNSHFKPFAAIGYEYNKVRANTGTPGYGSSVQFSIPQFGDFFCDMAVNVIHNAVSATVGEVPALPDWVGTIDQSLSATASVSGLANIVSGVYTKYTHQYVNAAGTVQTVAAAASNFVRYAEFPGQRLFKKVKFEVNGNPLDDYTAEAMLFHQKFRVAPGKQTGWKRLVGQEVPVDGYTDLMAIAGASRYAPAATDLTDVNGDAVGAGPVSSAVTARKLVSVVSGAQTAKATQPALEMWIPLIFWCNTDSRQAIASVSIPYGQRFITVDIEAQSNILFVAPGNLFLQLTVEEQVSTVAAAGFGTAASQDVAIVRKYITRTPVLATGSTIADIASPFSAFNLYINNIFVNPEIHDIYIKRIGFSLIRVHRFQSTQETTAANSVLMAQMKWPIEYIFVGMRPNVNVSAANPNQYRDWHRLTLVTDEVLETTAVSQADMQVNPSVAGYNALTTSDLKVAVTQSSAERVYFPYYTETIDTVQIQAHGINIYDFHTSAFYRDYASFTFGGANLVTPEDQGALMINFSLYPGTYQPSGHMNISRAREFYFNYTSSYNTTASVSTLLLLAKAINFLLISDGSAVLRYST